MKIPITPWWRAFRKKWPIHPARTVELRGHICFTPYDFALGARLGVFFGRVTQADFDVYVGPVAAWLSLETYNPRERGH